jgi:hypothetical protein
MRASTSLLLISTLATGCAVQRQSLRPAPQAPERTFAVTASFAPRALAEDAPRDQSALIAPAYAANMRGTRRAVLVAPAECMARVMRSQVALEGDAVHTCELLLGTLERQLGAAGYKIIPWQALAALDAPTTLEAARELQAEVVFEVGAITPSLREQRTTLSFAQVGDDGALSPVQVHSRVGHRCAGMLQQRAELPRLGLPTSLSISAIDAESGQPVWLYRHHMGDKTAPSARTLYFREQPGERGASAEEVSLLEARRAQLDALYDEEESRRATGGALLLSGGLLSGVGGVTLAAASDDSLGTAGALLLGLGVAALVADAAIIAPQLGVASDRADALAAGWNARPGRAHDPEQVICATPPVAPPWQADAQPAAAFTYEAPALLEAAPLDVRSVVLEAAAADMIGAMQRDLAP